MDSSRRNFLSSAALATAAFAAGIDGVAKSQNGNQSAQPRVEQPVALLQGNSDDWPAVPRL